jgi:nitrite reductase (NO-forming)
VFGLGFLLVSGGVWKGQALYDFAICTSSLAISGPSKANAATTTVVATPAPAMPAKEGAPMSDMHAPTVFTLRTGVADGRMVYLGVGGDIDGVVNPKLIVHEGDTVQINLVNGEGAEHDIVVDQYGVRSNRVVGKGAGSAVAFTASKTGEFAYYCSAPGHREAGMEGRIQVEPGPRAASVATAADISRDPADLPPPIGNRPQQIVRVDLKTVEVQGQSPTRRPTTTGPSTARFPARWCACASATPSRCISPMTPTAS